MNKNFRKKYNNIILILPYQFENLGYLKEYMINNADSVWCFIFPMGFASDPIVIKNFKSGKKIIEKKINPINFNIRVLNNLYCYFCYIYFVCRYIKREENSTIITMYPLFLMGNSIVNYFKKIMFVYWIFDYFPENRGIMRIYNKLVGYYNRNLEYVLYLTERIKEKYKKRKKYSDVVPLGIKRNINVVKLISGEGCVCGFIGNIRKIQGLEIIFQLIKHNTEYSLEIIGDGEDFQYYKILADKMGISEKVFWYKSIYNQKKIEKIISGWNIGFAPYNTKTKNSSYYGDPGKLKLYFSLGLPVITTNTALISKDIIKFNAGEVIDYNLKGIERGADKIINNYNKYTKGVSEIISKYDYSKLYNEKFNFLDNYKRH